MPTEKFLDYNLRRCWFTFVMTATIVASVALITWSVVNSRRIVGISRVASICDSYHSLGRTMTPEINTICVKAWAKQLNRVRERQREDVRKFERNLR